MSGGEQRAVGLGQQTAAIRKIQRAQPFQPTPIQCIDDWIHKSSRSHVRREPCGGVARHVPEGMPDEHDHATRQRARHGVVGPLQYRILILTGQQRQEIGT